MDFKEKLLSTLASSKFQAFIGGLLLTWGTVLQGKIDASSAVTATIVLVLGYMGFRSFEDGMKRE